MPELITPEQLVLPVIRIGNVVRLDHERDQLKLMLENALDGPGTKPVPQYFWDRSGQWYQAVNIRKVGRLPFLIRLFNRKDLMIAEYQLVKLDGPPARWIGAFKQLAREYMDWASEDIWKDSSERPALRKSAHSAEAMIEWMDSHFENTKYSNF
jgi:hypothetical protein